jgi:hypothetical protein
MKSLSVRLSLVVILFSCICSTSSKAQVDIDLTSPANEYRFTGAEIFTLKWVPVNSPAGSRTYTITVVTINDGQTPEEALLENEPFIEHTTPASTTTYARSQQFDNITLPKDTWFAWQVTANFPDTGETGESEIGTFYSPLSIPGFHAGIHSVIVTKITNADRSNFAGTGRVRLSHDANTWSYFEFDGLVVNNNSGFNVLTSGNIIIDTTGVSFELAALDENNIAKIMFGISRYRVNAQGVYVYGSGEIPPPLHTEWADENEIVTLDSAWVNFNSFVLNGPIDIPANQELLIPAAPGFKFVTGNSKLYINTSKFWYGLYGNFILPSPGMSSEPITIYGVAVEDFDILSFSSLENITIPITVNAGMYVDVKAITLDLSASASVPLSEDDPSWTGAIFDNFGITMHQDVDTVNNHLILSDAGLTNQPVNNGKAYLTNEEWYLSFSYEPDVETHASLDVYSVSIDSVVVHITNDDFTDSNIHGKIMIPAITDTHLQMKIPVVSEGLDTCMVRLPESEEYAVLSKPYLAVVSDTLPSGFQLNWYPDQHAIAYRISISNDGFETTLENFNNIDTGTDTAFIAAGLDSETKYWYLVHAVSEGGTVSTSLMANITTEDAPPPPPVVTGVERELSEGRVYVTPNPFTSSFEIVHPAVDERQQYFDASVYTVTGQLVYHSHQNNIGDISRGMNQAFTGFKSGLYVLQLKGNDGHIRFGRMVKK